MTGLPTAPLRVWLDISETVTQKLPVECSFVGAYCYAAGVPVTIYAISKQFFSEAGLQLNAIAT